MDTVVPPHLVPVLTALWHPVPVWLVLLGILLTVAFGQNHRLAVVLVAIASPVLNSRKTALSLGRVCLFGMLTTQIHLAVNQPQVFAALGWPPAMVLILIDLFLLAYCFGDKPWIREMATKVSGGLTYGGGIGSLLPTRSEGPEDDYAEGEEVEQAPSHSSL